MGLGTRLAGAGLAAGIAAASLAGCSQPGGGHQAHRGAMLALAFGASPVKFHMITCGRLSPAEQRAAHTRAPFGVVIRATNTGAESMMPTFTVTFLRGPRHKWDGVNYTTSARNLALPPGRSRDFEADIGASEWAGHPGDSCVVTQEDVFKVGQFTDVSTYRASAVPLQVHTSKK
jgi:hypothetical protein